MCHLAHLILAFDSSNAVLCFDYDFVKMILIEVVSQSNQFHPGFIIKTELAQFDSEFQIKSISI